MMIPGVDHLEASFKTQLFCFIQHLALVALAIQGTEIVVLAPAKFA